MLEWFAKLDSKLVCDFLERWPSLEELQKVPSAELKKFFRHRRGRHGELTEWRMHGIGQATAAIRDRAVIEAKQTVVQVIAQLLRTLLEGIATLERKIAEAAEVHPDFFIHSIAQSVWARAYYQRQRERGKEHHAAVRALAFKWIRIVFRCWQDRVAYDETRYLTVLAKRGSHLTSAFADVAVSM